MEIILLQDVNKLGQKDDIARVKDGYGSNYLIPKGMAIAATASAKKMHAENLRQRAHKEEKNQSSCSGNGPRSYLMSGLCWSKNQFIRKNFGSVNTIQIAEAFKNKGFEIDRKSITLPEDQIKEIGVYKAVVKLHRDVKVDVEFEIIAE
jgi:large subunit ribosomal protein L9